MDRISEMADVPDIATERIFHEMKPSGKGSRKTTLRCVNARRVRCAGSEQHQFVFLSCAQARTGSVVHTTVDADVQSAWAHTPQSVKLQTTHFVRCETEILRVKSS
jgi:hypothetical protein